MPNLARSTFRGLLCLSAFATLACADSTPAEPRVSLGDDPSASTVYVTNDGPVALVNVKVRTSEADALPVVSTLAPGATAGPYGVSVMHSYPLVEVTMQGRTVIANPVEGFAGFNPPRAAGAWEIRMRPASESNTLDIRVAPRTP